MTSDVLFICGLRFPKGRAQTLSCTPTKYSSACRVSANACKQAAHRKQQANLALQRRTSPLLTAPSHSPRQWWFLSCPVRSFLAFSLLAQGPCYRSFLDLLPASHVCFSATGTLAESSRSMGLHIFLYLFKVCFPQHIL